MFDQVTFSILAWLKNKKLNLYQRYLTKCMFDNIKTIFHLKKGNKGIKKKAEKKKRKKQKEKIKKKYKKKIRKQFGND